MELIALAREERRQFRKVYTMKSMIAAGLKVSRWMSGDKMQMEEKAALGSRVSLKRDAQMGKSENHMLFKKLDAIVDRFHF